MSPQPLHPVPPAHWAASAHFYHVYPLGLCGAPARNDFTQAPVTRLGQLIDWIPHWHYLGVTAVLLGPVFESGSHGYDTADFGQVDRRLGTNATLTALVMRLHEAGIRVVLDGVFHHTGRDFWAFRDLQRHGARSEFRDWYTGVRFDRRSPAGDRFTYRAWRRCYDLPKLNPDHPPVREHLLEAARSWIRAFDIDGLRLDTANLLRADFLRQLGRSTRSLKPDFWLMGEVVTGRYSPYLVTRSLDSVTNYAAYAHLVRSHNTRDYAGLAGTLRYLFGSEGACRKASLYTFADNHDVNRIASRLTRAAHLYPLHVLLYTVPGIPSLYYGSEWGLPGRCSRGSDAALRPAIPRPEAAGRPHPHLADAIHRLAMIRQALPALRFGDYHDLSVSGAQFAFARWTGDQTVVVAVNAGDRPATLRVEGLQGRTLVDHLNHGEVVTLDPTEPVLTVPACWGRILEMV